MSWSHSKNKGNKSFKWKSDGKPAKQYILKDYTQYWRQSDINTLLTGWSFN
jgi:hypothetical protein